MPQNQKPPQLALEIDFLNRSEFEKFCGNSGANNATSSFENLGLRVVGENTNNGEGSQITTTATIATGRCPLTATKAYFPDGLSCLWADLFFHASCISVLSGTVRGRNRNSYRN